MLNLLDIFLKNIQIFNSIKICPVGAELYHVDRWKLTVALHNFVNVPKNWTYEVFKTSIDFLCYYTNITYFLSQIFHDL